MNSMTMVRTFQADPETVFDAWVSPQSLVAPVTRVEMDAVVGGQLRLSTGGAPADDLTGVFVRAERPKRLTYTWRWGSSPEETLIDVRFRAAGSATVVKVSHGGFLDDESYEIHRRGWVSYFDGLAGYL